MRYPRFYFKWFHSFSAEIQPFNWSFSFPLVADDTAAFIQLKKYILNSCTRNIIKDEHFTVEYDDSNFSIAEVLNHCARSLLFFSSSLTKSELNYRAILKRNLSLSMKKVGSGINCLRSEIPPRFRSKSFVFHISEEPSEQNEEGKIALCRLDLSYFNYSSRRYQNHSCRYVVSFFLCAKMRLKLKWDSSSVWSSWSSRYSLN